MGFLSKLFGGRFLGCKGNKSEGKQPAKASHNKKKKLYLVLDLDLTLLDSTGLMNLTADEEYLKSDYLEGPKGGLFILRHMGLMTKLRPFVHKFLKEASQMFEMYINTNSVRSYALQMVELIDPKDEYFGGRVISRQDDDHHHGTGQQQKNLNVLEGREGAVVILDDTKDVWDQYKDNLILMKKYSFFASSCAESGYEGESLAQLKRDERELDGALASILDALKKIHHAYFNELGCNSDSSSCIDVRQVMASIRKKILKGCKIVFPAGFLLADKHYVWKMAERLGAICTTESDISATHVVSTDAATHLSRWAVEKKKLLVNQEWVEDTYYLWKKQPEANFPVKVLWPSLSLRC